MLNLRGVYNDLKVMGRLFLLMFGVTAIEIYLLIKVGGVIGAIPTVLLIFVTAAVGSWQLRQQGVSVLNKLQTLEGEPNKTILEGLVLLVCAVLLITPGILTDLVGFIGLVPAIRGRIVNHLIKNSAKLFSQQAGGTRFFYYQSGGHSSTNNPFGKDSGGQSQDVFEGEFEVQEDAVKPKQTEESKPIDYKND